jgi:acetyl esterase/lipase
MEGAAAVLRDVAYAAPLRGLPAGSRRVLDLYVPVDGAAPDLLTRLKSGDAEVEGWPAAPGARAAVAWVHGGSWMAGTHAQASAREACKCLARLGHVACSVNYRRCTPDYRMLELGLAALGAVAVFALVRSGGPAERAGWLLVLLVLAVGALVFDVARARAEVRHPAPARDVAAAVGWLHAHAAKLGADPRRLVLMGHSAGAHLVTHVAAHARYLADEGVPLAHVAGVVGLSGVYSARLAAEWSPPRLICMSVFGRDPRAWPRCFPAEAVRRHPRPEQIPPVLLLTAEFELVAGLHAHAIALRRALRRRGVPVRVENVRGTTHFSIVARWRYERLPLLLRLHRFVRAVCAAAAQPEPTAAPPTG